MTEKVQAMTIFDCDKVHAMTIVDCDTEQAMTIFDCDKEKAMTIFDCHKEQAIRVEIKKIPVRHWVLQVREFCQTYFFLEIF